MNRLLKKQNVKKIASKMTSSSP